jgi:hypothetical protein
MPKLIELEQKRAELSALLGTTVYVAFTTDSIVALSTYEAVINKAFIFDSKTYELIEEYPEFCKLKTGLYRVVKHDKEGIINNRGEYVIPVVYDMLYMTDSVYLDCYDLKKQIFVRYGISEQNEITLQETNKFTINGDHIEYGEYKGNDT